ncbi:FHA domain-containing protein [Microbacterium sp. IO18]|uniref:FHA domain-containing protein n=1 Tax=Microbacterium sp. IO18 TaxID=3390997 RepID=UPI003BA1F01C
MSDEKIPSYPVVHVTMQPDGSAHVNVAGKHVDYPAADVEVTRAQVVTYAIDVAARLARGVRMTTVDPDGEWKLGVYPDGEVVDLDPTPAKGRGAAKKPAVAPRPPVRLIDPVEQAPAAPAAAAPKVTTRAKADTDESHTVVITRVADATRVQDATTPRVIAPKPARGREPGTLVATLAFSTGDTAVIGPHAIIGRVPAATATDPAGSQLVVIHDKERKVSRVHCEVGWVGSKLVVTDRASGNGTYITRRGTTKIELEPGKPYELQGDDWLGVGTDVTCRVTIAVIQAGGTR